MQYTDNNGLIIKEKTDNYSRENFNKCMNIIDDGLCKFYVANLESTNTYKVTTGLNKTELKDSYSIKVAIPSNSNGAVSIIVDSVTVPVKKPNGNPVSNFKQNGVYSLTYYNGNFILASGSDESDSTSVGTTGDKVLAGETFIGSDGEVHTGQIPIRNAVNTTLKAGQSVNFESGYYKDKSTIKAETLATTMTNAGVTLTSANQLVKGVKAVDKNGNLITGNATVESLGGKQYFSNYYTNTILTNDTNNLYIPLSSLNIPFTPSVIKGYLRTGIAGEYKYSGFSITSGTSGGTGWGIKSYYNDNDRKYISSVYYNINSNTRIEVYRINDTHDSTIQAKNRINEIFIEAYS